MTSASLASGFNYNNIQFEAPIRHDLANLTRHYYTQTLKCNGQDIYFTTDWFQSHGVTAALDRKNEMLVIVGNQFATFLKNIQDIAIASGLQIPVEFQTNLSRDQVFKYTPSTSALYIKLNYNTACFDKNCKPIKLDALSSGDFRVCVHVKGLYIGPRPNGQLASMQLRITQIQNIPKISPCMFTVQGPEPQPQPQLMTVPMPIAVAQSQNSNPAVDINTSSKKGRKPKLQRQNAVVENRILPETLPTLTSEFFNELDLSALQPSLQQ